MKLLLDSHVILWHQEDDPRLPRHVSDLTARSDHLLCISIATFWELSIKASLGKLKFPGGIERIHGYWVEEYGAELVSIRLPHLLELSKLPQIHRDPFDRLLIAQALTENLTLVSGDPNIHQYPDLQILW